MDDRDRILEAALGLLAESGAHELTRPKISKVAGVRQSHLTYYFPTRADLLQEVARYSVEKLAGELAAERDHSPAHVAEKIAAGAGDPGAGDGGGPGPGDQEAHAQVRRRRAWAPGASHAHECATRWGTRFRLRCRFQCLHA